MLKASMGQLIVIGLERGSLLKIYTLASSFLSESFAEWNKSRIFALRFNLSLRYDERHNIGIGKVT